MANRTFTVRIERQDDPSKDPYWQSFEIDYDTGFNVTVVLQRISANPTTSEGLNVPPVAYESGCLEEVRGSCTMRINGKTIHSANA